MKQGIAIIIPDRRRRVHQVVIGKFSDYSVIEQHGRKEDAEKACKRLARRQGQSGWGDFWIVSPLKKEAKV